MTKILIRTILLSNFFIFTYSCSKDDEVEPTIIDTWTKYLEEEKVPFSNRIGMASFVINNNVYMGGGTVGISSLEAQNDFYKLDVRSNMFTEISSFPAGVLNWASAFSIGDFGYIVTGTVNRVSSKIVYKFSEATQEWTRIGDFPGDERLRSTSIVHKDKAYIGLGGGSTANMRDFWEFDPATEKWTELAPFPGEPRYAASGFSVDNFIFVGGGIGKEMSVFSDFWKYDPASDVWSEVASLPTGLGGSSSGSVNNFGYIIGGLGKEVSEESMLFDVQTTAVSKVYRYDPKQDSWFRMRNFPDIPRADALSFVVDGKIFFGSSGVITTDDGQTYNTWLNDNDLYYYTP